MADATGITFGVDVSHHQPTLDAGELQGIDLVIARTAQVKGGKYGTTIDEMYATHKRNALAGGKLFSSYLYLGDGVSPADNANIHESVEPDRSVPVMLDWEDGSGDASVLFGVYAELTAMGYHVWATYAPQWYWKLQGQPNLTGLPPLASSRYPDTAPGPLASEYSGTPDSYWNGYGGLSVVLLQFSANGRVAPYSGVLDLDAFKGSRAELAALLTPGSRTGSTFREDLAMIVQPANDDYVSVPVPVGADAIFIASAYGRTVTVLELWAIGDTPTGGPFDPSKAVRTSLGAWTINSDRPGPIKIPAGTRSVTLRHRSDHAFTTWCDKA